MNIGRAFTLVFMLIFLPRMSAGQSQDAPATEGADPAEIAIFAQRIYLDPQSGRLLSKPPPGADVLTLSPTELNMLSTSHDGLVERPLAAGGYMLDLQGRFRHVAVATVDGDGTIVIREEAGEVFLPAGSEQPEKNENNEE